MNQRKAFKATIKLAEERGMPEEHEFPSLSLSHIRNMEARIVPGYSDAKVGRWLGWAQCAVVASGLATLEEMKQINLEHQADESVCKVCGSELSTNAFMIGRKQVFCPNTDCVMWVKAFWIDR